MHSEAIKMAAHALLERRRNKQLTARLALQLRPQNAADALAIQRAVTEQLIAQGDAVAGWKCSLPIDEEGLKTLPVAAPIFASTVFARSPCPIQLDDGVCKIEPELGFRLRHDLPSRSAPYTEAEIIAALSGAHLTLELIKNRYQASAEAGYLEHLADCLFNQGLYVGPQIPLDEAFAATEITFSLSQAGGPAQPLPGKHPHRYPQLPLFWLVNFLSQQGIGLHAGQLVITGSYAGVIEVAPQTLFSLQYAELGGINLQFESDHGAA